MAHMQQKIALHIPKFIAATKLTANVLCRQEENTQARDTHAL
jgi:hypothetical protein